MNCTICAFDNPADSRFCKKCGAALVSPGPGPASLSASSIPPTPESPASGTAAIAAATAAVGSSPPDGATVRRLPLWPFLALALAVVLAGYAAYRLLGYDKPSAPVEASTATPAVEAPAAPADGSTAGTATVPPGATGATATGAPEGAASASPEVTGAAPEPEPAAAPAAKAKPHPRPAPKPAPKPAPVAEPKAPTPAAAPVARPAAAPAPKKDRWAQMLDAIASQCGKETFLDKVICEQKVRIQYCDGYWGKVQQCPMGMRDPDKGSGS